MTAERIATDFGRCNFFSKKFVNGSKSIESNIEKIKGTIMFCPYFKSPISSTIINNLKVNFI